MHAGDFGVEAIGQHGRGVDGTNILEEYIRDDRDRCADVTQLDIDASAGEHGRGLLNHIIVGFNSNWTDTSSWAASERWANAGNPSNYLLTGIFSVIF